MFDLGITNILQRFVSNLRYQLAKHLGQDINTDDLGLEKMDARKLMAEWKKVMIEVTDKGHKIVLIIDGLEDIDHGVKAVSKVQHAYLL